MPDQVEHGGVCEARLLLELCHRLCQRIGLDKVLRDKLSLIKAKAGPPCTCVYSLKLWVRSPFNDELSPCELPHVREQMKAFLAKQAKEANLSTDAGQGGKGKQRR
jgi:hypothetical protein